MIGASDAVLGLRQFGGQNKCVRGGRSSGYFPQSSAAVSLKPDGRPWCVSGCQSCHGKERTCWTTDTVCRLDPHLTPQYDSELDLGSPEALVTRDEESCEEDRAGAICFAFRHSEG